MWKQSSAIGLAIVTGLSGGLWMLTAIDPPVAQAAPSRISITLDRQPDESYETMERRAESIARAVAQRSFDSNILVTDVVVTIVGANRGLEAPILMLQVSRQQWRSRPDPQLWATYFRSARALLQIEPLAPAATQPAAQPAAVQPATAQPAAGQPSAGQPNAGQPNSPQPAPNSRQPAPSQSAPSRPNAIPLPIEIPGNPTIPQSLPASPADSLPLR